MNRRRLGLALALTLLALAAGCEGLFTGARESVHPLTAAADGSFAPVVLELDPKMNPIAFNLRGSTVASPLESGRWNSYRATLLLDGAPIGTASFNVNNAGSDEMPQGGAFATTMLIVAVPQSGRYELNIVVAKPREISIESPALEVRRNVEPANPPGR